MADYFAEIQYSLASNCEYCFWKYYLAYFTEVKIGIWNAWLGFIIIWLIGAPVMIFKPRAASRLIDTLWYDSVDEVWAFLSMTIMYAIIVISIWIPLKTGTLWFYVGFMVWLLALAGYLTALHNYAATPQNEAVTKGIYKYSRNPLYFFYSLATLGICIASASLLLFAVWIIYNIATHVIVLSEERYCLEFYGDEYEKFKKLTPRYF